MKKAKKIIGKLALGLACIILLCAAIGYHLISHDPQRDKVIVKESYEARQSKPKNIKSIDYGDEVRFARGAQVAEARKHFKSSIEDYGIGSIYMPKAGISVSLLEGTSEWNLYNGVGTGRANQKLGEGLFIGLSHNIVNQTLLKNIDKMKEEDLIYISDFQYVYVYKTLEQKVVHENEGKYFHEPNQYEKPKLLLYRCEGRYGTEWRRIIYGEYISKYTLDEVDQNILSGLNIELVLEKDNKISKLKTVNERKKNIKNNATKKLKSHEIEGRTSFMEKVFSTKSPFIGISHILSNVCLEIYKFYDSHILFFCIIIIFLYKIYDIS